MWVSDMLAPSSPAEYNPKTMNESLTPAEPVLLAIDTATGGCAVAVCRGAETLATDWSVGQADALLSIERELGDEQWTIEFSKT